jgi:hypothetical protein
MRWNRILRRLYLDAIEKWEDLVQTIFVNAPHAVAASLPRINVHTHPWFIEELLKSVRRYAPREN